MNRHSGGRRNPECTTRSLSWMPAPDLSAPGHAFYAGMTVLDLSKLLAARHTSSPAPKRFALLRRPLFQRGQTAAQQRAGDLTMVGRSSFRVLPAVILPSPPDRGGVATMSPGWQASFTRRIEPRTSVLSPTSSGFSCPPLGFFEARNREFPDTQPPLAA